MPAVLANMACWFKGILNRSRWLLLLYLFLCCFFVSSCLFVCFLLFVLFPPVCFLFPPVCLLLFVGGTPIFRHTRLCQVQAVGSLESTRSLLARVCIPGVSQKSRFSWHGNLWFSGLPLLYGNYHTTGGSEIHFEKHQMGSLSPDRLATFSVTPHVPLGFERALFSLRPTGSSPRPILLNGSPRLPFPVRELPWNRQSPPSHAANSDPSEKKNLWPSTVHFGWGLEELTDIICKRTGFFNKSP